MAVRLTVQFTVQPGKGAAFADFMRTATARVRAEDGGCELYDLFHHAEKETRFVLLEAWATAEDLDAHMVSPAFIAVRDGMREFLAGAATVHRYQDRE